MFVAVYLMIACSIYDICIMAKNIAMYRYTGVSLQAYKKQDYLQTTKVQLNEMVLFTDTRDGIYIITKDKFMQTTWMDLHETIFDSRTHEFSQTSSDAERFDASLSCSSLSRRTFSSFAVNIRANSSGDLGCLTSFGNRFVLCEHKDTSYVNQL